MNALTLLDIPDLPEEAFGGDIPPMQRKALVRAMGIRPQKGGGIGSLVGVVAAIAIPLAAPMISSALSLSSTISSALTTAGMTAMTAATTGSALGSAIVGAGLGAVTAAMTGQNIGRTALMGGITGGIGGYFAAPTLSNSAVSPQALAAANASSDPIAALSASQGWTTGAVPPANLAVTTSGQVATMGPAGWEVGGQVIPSEAIAYGGQVDSALAAQLSSTNDVLGAANAIQSSGTLAVNTPTAVGGNTGYLGTTKYLGTADIPQAGLAVTPQAEAAARQVATGGVKPEPTNALEALKQKFTDPRAQADMILRASAQLAGSALAGDGLSPEQRQLLNQQAAELSQLKATNKELFDQRLAWAQGILGEAGYYNPEYFGLQAQRGVQTAGARAERDALRKLNSTNMAGLRASEARRYGLGIATGGEAAYLQGADMAQQNKLRTMQAGLGLLPTASPEYSAQYANLINAYTNAEATRNTRANNIGAFFGDLTGAAKAQNRGLTLSFG